MAFLSIQEAARQAGTSKVDVWRAIQEGALLAQRTDVGGFAIDPTELFRVFEPQRPNTSPVGQDQTAFLKAAERPEITTETNATPETPSTDDMAVAFAPSGAELRGFVKLPVEVPANDDLHQSGERQVADLAERTAQVAELSAEQAKTDNARARHAALEKRATPWWRRLVEWFRTRRGRAARQRLRERL